MKVEIYPAAPMDENGYVVTDEVSGEAMIVDPGAAEGDLLRRAQELGGRVKYVLFTHRHFDHVFGAAAVQRATKAPLVIHEEDAQGLSDPSFSLYDRFAAYYSAPQEPVRATVTVQDGDELPFGGGTVRVLHTPGHTAGGVCYALGDLLFTGDTLFCGSMGRVDLPGGSSEQMNVSLRRLWELEGDRTVYPGHGEATTLEKERRTNIYMKRAKHGTLSER